MLALADDDVDEVKKNILEKLVKYDVPHQFYMGKPKLPVLSRSTEITELVASRAGYCSRYLRSLLERWRSGSGEMPVRH